MPFARSAVVVMWDFVAPFSHSFNQSIVVFILAVFFVIIA